MKKVYVSIALLVGGILCAATTQAAVTRVSSDAVAISAPSSVVQGAFQDNDNFYVFEEIRNFTLTSDLSVDWLASDGGALSNGNGGFIDAGTRINSYFLHFDPNKDEQKVYGELTFSDPVLAVIYSRLNLKNTDDMLGASGTAYADKQNRGYEPGVDLKYRALITGYSLWITNQAGKNFTDQARVITAAPVPVPAALWLFGSGILAMLVLRRKRNASAVA